MGEIPNSRHQKRRELALELGAGHSILEHQSRRRQDLRDLGDQQGIHRLGRQLALQLGAKLALEPRGELSNDLRDLEPYGFDVVTEATGAPKVIASLPQYATPGGKILYYGVAPDDARVEISPYKVFRHDLTILGSFSLLGTVPQALEWLASGCVQVTPLITHRLPTEELKTALEYKDRPGMNGSLKVLIVP